MQITESLGIFGRLGRSLKGIFAGLILSVVAVGVLVFNERNAVQDIRANKEIDKEVSSVDAGTVDASMEGKLIHLNGFADTEDLVANEQFGISQEAIRLSWKAEAYQWKERKETKTEKKVGGSEERVTTYSYEKVWSEDSIDSSGFREQAGHKNPGNRQFSSGQSQAETVTLGAFRLPKALIDKITSSEPYPLESIPAPLQSDRAEIVSGVFYSGDADAPQVGDERVSFTLTEPGDVSVMAVQTGDTFSPYKTKSGKTRFLLYEGLLSADEIVQREEQKAAMLRWALRVIGFILMATGFGLVLKPLSVLADVIPFFGNLVGMVTGFVAAMFAAGISLVIIAISWVAFRPLIGIPLLVVALAALFLGVKALMGRKNQVPAAA
ncbi:MAG: TMEM43 family protein [Verrucomicrobiota bacterium JB023]|nr:TMEM43 family protein [Verrucomicrobiota bacterium JB023]